MADFIQAFNNTMKTEYGYNPGNGEAETINGVDRSMHPALPLWGIVDTIKKQNPGATIKQLNRLFDANKDLQSAIQYFYRATFWGLFDEIKDQQVANALFDAQVNPCIITGNKAAQIAANVAKHGIVKVDGNLGALSIIAINSLKPELFVTAFNGVRIANYYERVRLSPNMAQWLPSWVGRCKPYLQIA